MPHVRAVACLARQRATHLFFTVTHQNKSPSPQPRLTTEPLTFLRPPPSPPIFPSSRDTGRGRTSPWKIHRTFRMKSFRNKINRPRTNRTVTNSPIGIPFPLSLSLSFFLFLLLLEGNAAVKTVVLRRGVARCTRNLRHAVQYYTEGEYFTAGQVQRKRRHRRYGTRRRILNRS